MKDIKITTGPGEGAAIEAAEEVRESIDAAGATRETSDVSGIGADSVERIAADVAAGRAGREEAVERILADVMGSEMVSDAPPELRRELESILNTLLEEDPHLQSLAAAIGPREIG